MHYRLLATAVAMCGGLCSYTAHAQSAPSTISFEAQTDLRERGISWSDGKPALSIGADLNPTYNISVAVGTSTLRNSPRHGGADAALTITPRYTVSSAGWDFSTAARANVFVGQSGMSYYELMGDVSRTIGPAQVTIGAAFAPSQNAIGGSNLYLDATASVSVPGTPFTIYGGYGHTSGSLRNDPRMARLRPGGDYADHHIGIERNRANLAVGLRYSGTSIGRGEVNSASLYYDRDYGSRIVAYVRVTP